MPVDALRFDAGSLSLNLVATVGRRFGEPVERLGSVDRLREWLARVGLEVSGRRGEEDLDDVQQLRAHVHVLLRSVVAADAIRLVAGNERAELRTCDADDCRMLYVAHGDRERRWCSSEACGNRSRVAAHRARRKAA
jgi:predicted RNA-binding Zn ribbon-like protein